MDFSSRKRKRTFRPPPTFAARCQRLLILSFSFFVFVLYFSGRSPLRTVSFRPVLTVSPLSLLSSSALDSVHENRISVGLSVEDRILFPDHVLLTVSDRIHRSENFEFDCLYFKLLNDSGDEARLPAISIDEYARFRSIIKCPLPPANYSAAVNLVRRGRGDGGGGGDWAFSGNQTVHSWERVAYEAVLDGDTTVVFVKGLNLRPGKESDPTHFRCHFGLGNWDSDEGFVLTTAAVSAAQEVVRCLLPRSIRMNPEKAQGIRITVSHGNGASAQVPSVAKVLNFKSDQKNNVGKKYELCVCSMLWNQASALREWIMYHSWLGVERWFIYDNNSEDGIQDVIEELNSENYNITRYPWPWIKTQEAGFSHCTIQAKHECNWVGFMDVDEFYYFPVHRRRFGYGSGLLGQNSLRNLVANFTFSRTYAEIRTACHSFGPSGLSSPPSQGVTAGYTCRLQQPERHKSIIRPDSLDRTLLNVVHHFKLKQGFRYLNLPQTTGVINHYKYQVWETFRAKFFRRVATYVVDWQENERQGSRDRAPGLGTEAIEPVNWRLQFCEVWDTGLRDFVLANLAEPATGLLPWERSSL